MPSHGIAGTGRHGRRRGLDVGREMDSGTRWDREWGNGKINGVSKMNGAVSILRSGEKEKGLENDIQDRKIIN